MDMPLTEKMAESDVSKTVYGYLYPEVEEVMERVFHDPNLIEMQRKGYTKRQDSMGQSFLDTYIQWTRSITDIDARRFRYVYPSAGSAEAIRETIACQASGNRTKEKTTLHMFDGDYEGYVAYAKAHGVGVAMHNRNAYEASLDTVRDGDSFYISQPSGIDGDLWKGYDAFMAWLSEHKPELDVFVDLAYVGTVPNEEYRIATHHKNIRGIFFSLSKAFGIFYQRIGGMFSDREWPSLYANRLWFKNLVNLTLGEALMKEFSVSELPGKYGAVQTEIVRDLQKQFGESVKLSDSILIAHQTAPETLHPIQKELRRTCDTIRYCLTPGLDRRISESSV